jgi:hypothetical protein
MMGVNRGQGSLISFLKPVTASATPRCLIVSGYKKGFLACIDISGPIR